MKQFAITNFVDIYPLFNGGLTLYQGNSHDYLGMDINYIEKFMVKMLMVKWLDNLIKYSQENLGTTAAVPAFNYLFKFCDVS